MLVAYLVLVLAEDVGDCREVVRARAAVDQRPGPPLEVEQAVGPVDADGARARGMISLKATK